MTRPFYSSTDADLATGANNVVEIVTPTPVAFGLTSGIVTSYTTLADNYSDLLLIATTPATRTSVAIGNKNAAAKLLRDASVDLARIITATPAVTNAQLLSLGMNERTTRAQRDVPATPPIIEVLSVSGRMANLQVHAASTDRRGIPFGAIGANIYSFVGSAPPEDPRDYHYEGMASRGKAQIMFPDSVPSGATVWLSACWLGKRGQTSVGSAPISFTLQGGAIPAAA